MAIEPDDTFTTAAPFGNAIHIQLPAPLPDLLLTLLSTQDGEHPIAAGVPLAAASDSALEADALAGLEAQFVADDLARTQGDQRQVAAQLAARVLGSVNTDRDVSCVLGREDALTLLGWYNHTYVHLRTAELAAAHEAVGVGVAQSALAMMGLDLDEDEGQDGNGTGMTLATMTAAVLVSQLADALDELGAQMPLSGPVS